MRRIVMADMLDLKDLIKEDFYVALASKESNIEANSVIFNIPNIFPNKDSIEAYRKDGETEFDKAFHAQLDNDEMARLQIAGVLYGIINHGRKIAFIKYHNEITTYSFAEQKDVIINVPFLQSFGRYLKNNYGVEWMNFDTYLRRFKNQNRDFSEGEIYDKGPYIKLLEQFKDILQVSIDDVPENKNKTNKFEKKKFDKNKKVIEESSDPYESYINMRPAKLPLLVLQNSDDSFVLKYLNKYGLREKALEYFNVNDITLVPKSDLAKFVKYNTMF